MPKAQRQGKSGLYDLLIPENHVGAVELKTVEGPIAGIPSPGVRTERCDQRQVSLGCERGVLLSAHRVPDQLNGSFPDARCFFGTFGSVRRRAFSQKL
jgi:hypothetical protein